MNGKHLLMFACVVSASAVAIAFFVRASSDNHLLTTAGVGFFLIGFCWLEWRRRVMLARKKARTASRISLTDSELHNEFSSSVLTPEEVDDFLRCIEEASEVSRSRLREGDQFCRELAPEKGWEYDDGLGLIPLYLQKRFGGNYEDYDLNTNPTVRDLLQAVEQIKLSGGHLETGLGSDRVWEHD